MAKAREIAIGLRNIVLGSGLASWKMISNPKEWAVASTEMLAVWDSITDNKGLKLINVHEAFDFNEPIPVTLWNPPMSAISGRTVDMLALCQLCRILSPGVVFEIGTLHGETAMHFAMNGAGAIYTLDLPPEHRVSALSTTTVDQGHQEDYANTRMVFEGMECENQITRLFGDSATFDYSPYANRVDLFFIDGAHSYEYVRSDTLKALSCLKPGGTITWHDFGRRGVNGVSKWLRELNGVVPVFAIPGGSLAFAKIEDTAKVLKQFG